MSLAFKKRFLFYSTIVFLWFVWFVNMIVMSGARYIAVDCYNNIDNYPVAIVLGARVMGASLVSDVYSDRLQTAVNLYKKGKITKILVSGDHGQINYDEVNTGKDYLLSKGVLSNDIFLDHAGFDTYSSIYRAKNIFKVKRTIIITQDFHLPRALYFGHSLGLDVLGCSADLQSYQNITRMKQREILARVKAWFSVAFAVSPRYMGDTYDITGNGQQTWDEITY